MTHETRFFLKEDCPFCGYAHYEETNRENVLTLPQEDWTIYSEGNLNPTTKTYDENNTHFIVCWRVETTTCRDCYEEFSNEIAEFNKPYDQWLEERG